MNEGFTLLAPRLLYLKQVVRAGSGRRAAYLCGPQWNLYGILEGDGTVEVAAGGEWRPVRSGQAVYVPPFSLVHWRATGDRVLESLGGDPGLHSAPDFAALLDLGATRLPISRPALSRTFDQAKVVASLAVDTHAAGIVKRFRRLIEQTYPRDLRLAELAEPLDTSYENLIRLFKRTYGLSPVAFRTRLRFMDSSWQILVGKMPVIEAAHAVGFSDRSGFYKAVAKEGRHTRVLRHLGSLRLA